MTSLPRFNLGGFTLPELLIAAAISLITASVAGDLLISHMRSSERAEALERQRSDWSRTTGFLEAEVALSERVFSPDANSNAPLPIAMPNGCGFSQDQIRLELDLRRDLPPVIYAVRPSTAGWLPTNTLWRCGPGINSDGSYNNNLSLAPIVDGLDGAGSGGGFAATASADNKQTNFVIALKGHARIAYTQQDSARTRISPLYSRPSENSLCEASNLVKLTGSSTEADNLTMGIGQVAAGEDVLICGGGYCPAGTPVEDCKQGLNGDSVTGSDNANDILEVGDYGRSVLNGEGGNDVLRGSLEADVLNGGSGNDTLIGRDGNDQLNGGGGENTYLPGGGDDTVIGGIGLDVVFYSGPQSDYSLSGSCSKTTCTVTGTGNSASDGEDNLSNIDILIFTDARVDITD